MSLAFFSGSNQLFYRRELIMKSKADFGVVSVIDEWVKGGGKEVAEKDEEAKMIVVVISRTGVLPLFRPAVAPAI